MRQKVLLALFATVAVGVNLTGIVSEDLLLRRSGELLFFLPLLVFYHKKLQLRKFNVMMFLLFAIGAIFAGFFEHTWYFDKLKMGFGWEVMFFLPVKL